MLPLFHYFPDIAAKEMRSIHIQGNPKLPDGEYGFLELYCDIPHCDCRRVLINVVRPETGQKIWATINFGWESPTFYQKWLGNTNDARAASGITLDPLNPQTTYAPALFALFRTMLQDTAYVERLKQHYNLVKQATTPPTKPQQRAKVKRGRAH